VVICLERCVDLHMAQLMLLPLTVSCSNKIQIGFTFLVPAHPGRPGKRAVKRVCVYAISQNKYFPLELLKTLDIENFATAYRSSKRVTNLVRERWMLRVW